MKTLFLILLSATAGAQEVLTYSAAPLVYTDATGLINFYQTPESLSGSLTIDGVLGANWTDHAVTPTAFSFAALLEKGIMNAPFNTETFSFSTDANANITGRNITLDNKIGVGSRANGEQWALMSTAGDGFSSYSHYGDCAWMLGVTPGATCDGTSSAASKASGKWSAVAAPEINASGLMSAMLFLGFGLAVLRGHQR